MNCNFNHFKNKSEHSLSVNVVFEQNYTIFRIYNKITIIACVFLIIHRISHCTQKNNGISYSSFQDDKALLVRKFELSVTKIYPNNLKMNYFPNLGFVPSFRALLQRLCFFFHPAETTTWHRAGVCVTSFFLNFTSFEKDSPSILFSQQNY